MRIISSIKQMQQLAARAKLAKKKIGFVPTMGALHQGHLSLIRQARKENDLVVVSIFVNPAQFGENEDFKKYPRVLNRDAKLCRMEGVDIIFYPDYKEMYPKGYKTYITVEELGSVLCAASRPGHFRGVATVVAKLFNIVMPDIAYFGQKDAQQSVIIKKLISDLNFPIKIKIMPIVREKDGLAMSSRNAYLSKQERADAGVLFKALNLGEYLIKNGLKDSNRIIMRMKGLIKKKKTAKIDYVSIADSHTLRPLKRVSGNCLIVLAVYIGKTRLIDNVLLRVIASERKRAKQSL